jgi:hypothetical protein
MRANGNARVLNEPQIVCTQALCATIAGCFLFASLLLDVHVVACIMRSVGDVMSGLAVGSGSGVAG